MAGFFCELVHMSGKRDALGRGTAGPGPATEPRARYLIDVEQPFGAAKT
jgi:hypothetical protein